MKEKFYYGKPALTYDGPFELDFGDDAVPYTGRCLISVADGTGARAGFPQRSIEPRLLRRADSFETATRGCLGKDPWRYRDQYEENFDYLFSTGSDYGSIGPRKSGYFGSRLTTIFMRRLVEDKMFHSDEELEERMHALRDATEEERDAMLARIEHGLVEKLDEKLKRAVENCGLDWDYSNDNNLSLMGTTYSGVVFCEEEDEVHMISIQAGDSLAAVLVPVENGEGRTMLAMRRLLPAQERASDGGLTNCVGTNHEFYFRCGYHRVKKPCAILTCSDGCFDAFPSERWFEHFVMSQLGDRGHGDLRDAMKSMRSYFATPVSEGTGPVPIYVSTDDSSTMAIAAFGFDHYMRLCKMAYRRMEDLNERYHMEGGQADLTLTPAEEARIEENRVNRNREKAPKLRPYAERCWKASEWLRRRSMERLDEPANQARVEAEIKTELSRNDEDSRECSRLEKELRDLVCRYWLRLREKPARTEGARWGRRMEEDPADKLIRLNQESAGSVARAAELREKVGRCVDNLSECAMSYSLPADGDARRIESCHTECMRRIDQCVRQLQETGYALADCEKTAAGYRREMQELERRILSEDAGAIDAACENLLRDEKPRTFAKLELDVQQNIVNLIRRIRTIRDEIQERIETVRPAVCERFACKLFMNRPVALIEETILEHADSLPEDLRAELQAIMDELDEKYPTETDKSRRERENDAVYAAEFEEIMVGKE